MQVSTHESVSLEKRIEESIIITDLDQIDQQYEVDRCAEWIKQHEFQKVCLQFPDCMLYDASEVARRLQERLSQNVYILGDTAYGSCCIDYVGAAHVNADAVIHFGPVCFSKPAGNIPCLYIYEKHSLDLEDFTKTFTKFKEHQERVILLLDTPFIHVREKILQIVPQWNDVIVRDITEKILESLTEAMVFIGSNERKLLNLSLLSKNLYHYSDSNITNYQTDPKILKRRYYLTEKIKDSKTIGIVVGTVSVELYLHVIERLKRLIKANKKKYYVISVGKPTVAKLANFDQVDLYVMITCSMSDIFESRDFHKPIVTPYDVEVSLNKNASNLKFSLVYNDYLAGDLEVVPVLDEHADVSLITGNIRCNVLEEQTQGDDKAVLMKDKGTMSLISNLSGEFLANRSWKGLEQNLGQIEVKLAEEGRSGIAQGYSGEAAN